MFRDDLMDIADADNAAFVARLIPTIAPERIIGARTPNLRKLAKSLWKSRPTEASAFLNALPHALLEEDLLHAFFIGQEKDPDRAFALVNEFLPHVDNWAVSDSLSPKALATDIPRLEEEIRHWIAADQPLYTRRFGVCMLMEHFLGEHFHLKYHEWVASIESEEYYLHMVQGWYFATAMAKQPDHTEIWLTTDRLPVPVRRKAIQKSIESYRVDSEAKERLRAARATIPRAVKPRKSA
ncbi:MAG: DNA alkylation repair protein [Actinomycetaceae bacterium]|nr:DNA alkylation repair protein [Actinomycetaceae bacterium]